MRDNNILRLRLVVKRHGIPEDRVMFAVQLDTDPTISNLLEQVNEVFPLESNDWGLEDYAVELRDATGRGFDCLHFQQVSVILKNDEEVFIRPLDTGDRRKRRLSGRDQIAPDGRHLIDGVAFGRPRLKTPRNRPSVDIPPLKRPRITYEAGEEDGEEPRLLLTQHGEDASAGLRVRKRARFGDAEGSESYRDEEVEDSDFTDGGSEEGADEGEEDLDDSNLEDELRDLNADNAQIQEDDVMEPEIPDTAAVPDRTTALDLDTLDKISALRVAFPMVPAEACERVLSRHRGDTESAFVRLQSQHQPRIPLDALLASANPSAPIIAAAEDDASDESEAESIASMIKHYDQHGFPSGSILAGTAAAQMAEAMRRSGHSVKPPVHTKFDGDVNVHGGGEPSNPVEGKDTDNDEDNDSGSDSEDDSGSGSDSDDCSGSDSDSNDGNDNGNDSGSDSESSSDSDDDSGPEVASSKELDALGGARLPEIRESSMESSILDGHRDEMSERISGSERDSSSDAGTGESRSDDSDDSSSDDSSSDDSSSDDSSSDDSGDDEIRADHSMNGNAKDDSSTDSSESEAADLSDDDSSDGSVDFSSKYLPSEKTPSILMEQTTPRGNSAQGRQREGVCAEASGGSVGVTPPVPPGQGKRATQKRNARRRAARIAQNSAVRDEYSTPTSGSPMSLAEGSQDLVASIAAKKAALLQSLDTAHEEQSRKANDGLSSGNGNNFIFSQAPLPKSSVLESSGGDQQPVSGDYADSSVGGAGPQESSEAWRNKIVYRAVECCQDGVELSEPPFPFIQRWDPQQQYFQNGKNKRGGRSKRKQRNQEDFRYEGSDSGAKRRRYGGGSLDNDADDDYGESFVSHDGTTACEEMVLNYDDETPETQEQPGQTSRQDVDDEDDLPPLPSDVSILPKLSPSEAMVGMILTWKQWILSKATNWQPQVSALTGVVVEVINSNTLTVRLAKRDRNIDQNEKVYDDDGNRVYDKFELPGMDDEDEDAAEEGYRTLDLADMIEPRILQPVPEASGPASSARQLSDSVHMEHQEASSSIERVSATLQGPQTTAHDDGGRNMVPETPMDDEPVDPSISEDRRQEISLLIKDAGFRKDIDPLVTDNAPAVIRDDASSDPSSPSRQLQELTHDTTIIPSNLPENQAHSSPQLPSQTISNNVDSQPIFLEPFHGFSDPMSNSHDGRDVAYPRLQLPPSETGSLHSGRQVDPDFSIELGNDSLHDLGDPAAVSRSTLGRHSDDESDLPIARLEPDSGADSGSESSDCSSLSLSDLWASGSTARSKSPSKSAVLSAVDARKPQIIRDLEYEEAMRRLDDSDDLSEDDTKDQLSKRARALMDKPIERPTSRKPAQKRKALKPSSAPPIKNERASTSPAPAVLRTARATSSPFAVPEGSQVVSLLTSSPEPELEEHYAEDSIDETYNEPNMPSGSGWVKKQRTRRGLSVAAGRDPVSKPQSQQSTDKRPTAALNSLLRAKKKVLANMF